MPSGASAAVEPATKTKYKGGWLDKDLRRANSRQRLSAPPAASRLSLVWAPTDRAPHTDWVTTSRGSRFEIKPCGHWSGRCEIVTDEDKPAAERFYQLKVCRCPE